VKLASLHPELRGAFRFIPPFPLHNAGFVKLSNWLLAHAPRRKAVGPVAIDEQPLSYGRVRLYTPPFKSGGALLWIHGGGMILGSAAIDDKLCAQYAQDLGALVVSVEYRLASKHPFPAAIDDCLEAWHWLLEHAKPHGVDVRRVVVSGQSAGGGLAACLAQRIHDDGGRQPAGVALLCPMLDDRPAANVELDALAHRVWNNKNNRAGWAAYLAQPPGQPQTPAYAVAARRNDLRGLPPTWIATSDIDLLYDEALRYRERLEASHVPCRLYVVPQAPHGFEALLPRSRLARDLFRENCLFLRERMNLS
jgi:acetyl esterase/lipase